jgi:hypothetical protein
MDAQQTNTRRVRILQRACVATLAILIAAVLWQAYGPWLLSPHQHVTVH